MPSGATPRPAAAEPRKQRVAGRVAEGVVVVLEPVEVEEHEPQRLGLVGVLDVLLEVDHQAAAVREAGEDVGDRLVAGRGQDPVVVDEGERPCARPRDHRDAGQHERDHVQALEVVEDEQRDRAEPEQHRQDERGDALEPNPGGGRRWTPAA